MENEKNPIRDAMRYLGYTQTDIADKIDTTRQTMSRYINEFEKRGSVANPRAQTELERIMAEYQQKLNAENKPDDVLDRIRREKERLIEEDNAARGSYKSFVTELLKKYPNIPVYDWNEKLVDHENFDWENEWINLCEIENDALMNALTNQEKAKLDTIQYEMGRSFMDIVKNTELENSRVLEQLWDTTNPGGKPIVYEDTFECTIGAEEAGGELYDISCKTLCMCNGGTARIYVDKLFLPDTEHDLKLEVSAFIKVLTDRGTFHIGNIELECQGAPFEFSGQIDNLIPGYKYVFGIAISPVEWDSDIITDKENSLVEGYYTVMHPLK